MAVRVLITVTTPSAEAAEAAIAERVALCRRTEAEEEGCLQYEVFRSALHPERYVLCEPGRAVAYDKHWKLQLEREKSAPPKPPAPPPQPGAPQLAGPSNFTSSTSIENVDGTWMSADPEQRSETVRWR